MKSAVLPEGWLTDAEAATLSQLARNKLVLEIGSWKGRSTVALATTALHVVSVDHHRGSEEHEGSPWSLPEFLTNLKERSLEDKVSVCVMDARRLFYFRPASFDLVFVDGAHDFGSTLRDGVNALMLVKTSGAVVFHDYTPGWSSVIAAVEELQRRNPDWKLEKLPTMAVLCHV